MKQSYEEFVEKFKPKKTTDDCYTPPEVYDAIAEYVATRFSVPRERMVRPFYPGGDFEAFDYDDKLVVDNPPFSILSKIRKFYIERDIKYFLFAPALTSLQGANLGDCVIVTDCNIVYENGANVRTCFVTNMITDNVVETAPRLSFKIKEICNEIANTKKLPKYEYPSEIFTMSRGLQLCARGVNFAIPRGECLKISKLDAQRESGKSAFGSALLIKKDKASELADGLKKADSKYRKT